MLVRQDQLGRHLQLCSHFKVELGDLDPGFAPVGFSQVDYHCGFVLLLDSVKMVVQHFVLGTHVLMVDISEIGK